MELHVPDSQKPRNAAHLLRGPAGSGRDEELSVSARRAPLLLVGAEVDARSGRWQQHPYGDAARDVGGRGEEELMAVES